MSKKEFKIEEELEIKNEADDGEGGVNEAVEEEEEEEPGDDELTDLDESAGWEE